MDRFTFHLFEQCNEYNNELCWSVYITCISGGVYKYVNLLFIETEMIDRLVVNVMSCYVI